jgi:signal transduction histidine kinase/integral membrane sensor domain MASE1
MRWRNAAASGTRLMSATAVSSVSLGRLARHLRAPLITAVAYYTGAEAAFFVGTLSDKIFAPFWPPNVVLFCALLFAPMRTWWLFLAVAFPAHVLAELHVGMDMLQLLVAFATNCIAAAASAFAIRWILGAPPWFRSLRSACLYVLIATIAIPMAAAFGGAFVSISGGLPMTDYWVFWTQWFMSNALGSLTLGPVLLIWLSERQTQSSERVRPAALIEAVFIGVALVVVCTVAFEVSAAKSAGGFLPALLYAPLLFVLWATLRFGVKGAASAILIMAVVLVWRTLNGPSLFLSGNAESSVFAMQVFLLGLSIPVLLLGAAIDEARHAEQEVRESEERMSFAAVSANVCMWRFDYKSDNVWITDHGRDMLGFLPPVRITRAAMMDVIHTEDRETAIEAMRAAIARGALADCEFRIIRRNDAQTRWFRCRARAYGEYRGTAAHISGTFTDITEQKIAEIELAQQRQELAHLTRVSLVGELSGGIAHELTQPLSAILSNAEAARTLIAKDTPNLSEIKEALDDIIGEDNRAGEIIRRLRGLLKKTETNFEVADLNQIVQSTLRLLRNELVNRRVRVTTHLAKDLPLVTGDPIQLQQVLINLVLNAVDAMADTTPAQRVIVIVTEAADAALIQLRVSDRGTGLMPSHQDRVLQPFFTTKDHGLGLGLSLSSAIIKLHGGRLWLDNNPEAGVTATFTLPRPDVLKAAG